MSTPDGIDVILRLANLQSFVAGTTTAARGVRGIGTAAEETSTQSTAAATKTSGAVRLIEKAAIGTVVAIAAVMVESGRMAIKFDQQMELIRTQAGASQSEVVKMSAAILEMDSSGSTAQGPMALAAGLYRLESIGLRGAVALAALKVAAEGSDVGIANLETTTQALGAAWLSGIKGGGDFTKNMALMSATVGVGSMRMDDLVSAMGTGILPAAKLAGLGITDVYGALATLSDMGMSASSSAAKLATALHFITNPTTAATKALAQLGLTGTQLSDVMHEQGLPAALKLLKNQLDALPGGVTGVAAGQILGEIFPAGRGRVLSILMDQLDQYTKKINQIQGDTGKFAKDVTATHQEAAYK